MTRHYGRFELALMQCRTALAADPILWRHWQRLNDTEGYL